jgi:hypothetical protein
MTNTDKDEVYFELILKALHVCANYKPMFGKGRAGGGMSLDQFQMMYRADPFYAWVGLDSPLMYAAHKAAGGMTSIYRQLGMGCQWVYSSVLMDALGLMSDQATWNYQVPKPGGETRTLFLDGRIDLEHIRNRRNRSRVEKWLQASAEAVMLSPETRRHLKGAVFEVRQGYKSKDSKRQNADISNASNAYANSYLPVLLLLSNQIDSDVLTRYTAAQWLPLVGALNGGATQSTYVFCRDVVGYDLAGFFERNSCRIKAELEFVLKTLLEK